MVHEEWEKCDSLLALRQILDKMDQQDKIKAEAAALHHQSMVVIANQLGTQAEKDHQRLMELTERMMETTFSRSQQISRHHAQNLLELHSSASPYVVIIFICY